MLPVRARLNDAACEPGATVELRGISAPIADRAPTALVLVLAVRARGDDSNPFGKCPGGPSVVGVRALRVTLAVTRNGELLPDIGVLGVLDGCTGDRMSTRGATWLPLLLDITLLGPGGGFALALPDTFALITIGDAILIRAGKRVCRAEIEEKQERRIQSPVTGTLSLLKSPPRLFWAHLNLTYLFLWFRRLAHCSEQCKL